MEDEEKINIRKNLKIRVLETKKMILSLEEQSKAVAPDNAIGRITRMDAIQQRSLAEAQLRSHEETLYKLEEALVKIEQADFGICVKCKKNIPLERILIMPEARVCVPCASQI